MKVKDLIEVLLDCDKELDVVNSEYEDVYVVMEQTVHTIKESEKGATANSGKHTARHVVLQFNGEVC